jgi:hypothetical protein
MIGVAVDILFWIALFAAIVGIYKPWTVLWWLPIKNRKTVLKYYGIATVALLIVKLLI